MNKQLLLTVLVVLSFIFSVGAVCASEISVTDSYATSLVDDTSDVSVYNSVASSDISVSSDSNVGNDSSKVSLSSEEVLGSEDSNTLSTNTDSNKLKNNELNVLSTNIASGSNVNVVDENAASNDDGTSDDVADNDYILGASNAKKDVTFVAPDRTLYLEEISKGYSYPIILKDVDGNTLANRKVYLYLNGERYSGTTDNKGWAYFNLIVKNTGVYKVNLKFGGDAEYNSLSAYSVATVKVITVDVYFVAPNRTLGIDEISKGYSYPIILKDVKGHALADKKVYLYINGVRYDATTDNKGWAYFDISVDKIGKYKVNLKFASDGYYNSLSQYSVATIQVLGVDVSFVAPDRTLDLDDISKGYSYPVILKDVKGHALANKKVTITFNGKKQTGTTDSKGWVYFNITTNKVGKYGVSLAFTSDGYYNSLSCPNFKTVTVVSGKELVLVVEDRNIPLNEIYFGYLYPVIVKDGNGNVLPGKEITINFNGKKELLVSDSNGYCYFTITAVKTGNYALTLTFAGDGYYDATTLKKTVKVTESTNPYGNKAKKVWINADSGSDDMKHSVADLLCELGWEVYVDGTGPGYHYPGYYDVTSDYQVYITLYNGFCAGTVREAYYDYIQNLLKGKGVQLIIMWDTRTWTDPEGMAPYKYGDFDGYKAGRAWDDDFSKDDPTIEDVGEWLQLKNSIYCAGPTVEELLAQFSAGGYFKYTEVSLNDVLVGADYLKSYYEQKKTFPNAVSVSGVTYTLPEFIYLMSQEVYQLGNSKKPVNTIITGIAGASSTSGDAINAQLNKADYLTVAKNVLEFIRFDRQVPNYASSAVGKLNHTTLVDVFSRILSYYKNNNALPNYVTVAQEMSSDGSDDKLLISINDVLTGADNLKTYYSKNKAFPKNVTVSGLTFSLPEFLYVMSQATYQLGNSDTSQIVCIDNVKSASSPSGDDINTQLNKADYLTVAKNVANYIKTNNQAPNFASSAVGKLEYATLIDAFSRILAYYKNNANTLPNYVSISQKESSAPGPSSVSILDILSGADNLKTYYEKNGVLPNTITVAGYAFKAPEFLYLMDQAIYQLGQSNTSAIDCIYGIKAASSSSGDEINAQLKKADYLTVAKNVANYIKSNMQAPNFASSAIGKISYYSLLDVSSRILAYYKNNNALPTYVNVKQSSADFQPGGGNVINTITDLTPYYQSTKNCQVNNSQIKALVNSLTKGLTSDADKAIAIYNYVRDEISYSFYYDTKYGAVGTLNAKAGNCVDQSHLLVAMYRTAGLAARYEHGVCYFPLSGNTYGHVWTQVLIGNLWVVGDPTSNRNALGTVNNWDTSSYTHNAYYASLPF